MLRRAKELIRFKLGARDGEIGRVKDFYFDDHRWTVRYLVADTGTWLTNRLVLISPFAITGVNFEHQNIEVKLTKEQIENSPSIDTEKPVSRQFEADYARYFGWPMYWYGPALWGPTPYPDYPPNETMEREAAEGDPAIREERGDPRLRSASEVEGYHLQARDGELGHVEDLILDDQDWAIRFLEIDTRNWWPGKKVLISPLWIKDVSWDESKVFVDLYRETIKQAPAYDEDRRITPEFENELFEYYRKEAAREPVHPV